METRKQFCCPQRFSQADAFAAIDVISEELCWNDPKLECFPLSDALQKALKLHLKAEELGR
jgi:hypothetical protein